MAGIRDRVRNVLDETRTLILGAQILLGFQFQAVFQAPFQNLPETAQKLDIAALALMLAAVGLLIAPAPFHRLVEHGNDTVRLHDFASRMAIAAPLPFALCMGIDVFIVAQRHLGQGFGAVAGSLICLIGLFFWYGIEIMQRPRNGNPPAIDETHHRTSVEEKISTLSTETRVVIPGAQALLGFQFATFLTDRFATLPTASRDILLASLLAIALSIVLLMAFAPYHRIVARGEDRPEVASFGSTMLLAALVPLALGLAGDFYIVVEVVLGDAGPALAAAAAALAFLLGLWFGFPLVTRARRDAMLRRRA